ncbi:hemolysin family protein [Neisseriaceae bacterium TC5R-5]|nr:hemolysin family protein [Neisseriaceae bacterium TC5R-5]
MAILILLGLILLNSLFAMAEIAIVSCRKIRLQQHADNGHRGAQAALKLAANPSRFLSTIQIGITSISILSGVYGEAALSEELRLVLQQYPLVAPYSRPLSVTLIVIFITLLSLILGELVPKRLALLNPDAVAMMLARPMWWLSQISNPVVNILSRITDALLRVLGARKNNDPSITEEEIRVLMEQGADEGVFERTEQELVENIFRLDSRKVAVVMTPRKEIVYLDLNDPLALNLQRLQQHAFNHFPVCRGGMEQVVGVLHSKVVLDQLLTGQKPDLQQGLTSALYVPAAISLMQLLEQFKQHCQHLALIVDEYGDLEGLVTMNDVLEAIVGDMPMISSENNAIVLRDDGSWLVDGMVSLDHFKAFFALEQLLPGEESGNIHTLGGVVMYQLGRIPSVTDCFDWHGFRFEVVDMDKTRVDKIMVSRCQSSVAVSDVV